MTARLTSTPCADVAALEMFRIWWPQVRARAGKLADELLLAHVDDIALQTGARARQARRVVGPVGCRSPGRSPRRASIT